MQNLLKKEVENPNETKPQGRTVIDTLVMQSKAIDALYNQFGVEEEHYNNCIIKLNMNQNPDFVNILKKG